MSRKLRISTGLAAGILLLVLPVLLAPELQQALYRLPSIFDRTEPSHAALEDLESELSKTERRVAGLRADLLTRHPRGSYLVINTSDNRFRLMNGGATKREGICSTGSYVLLKGDGQQWMFQTPRGAFRILEKRRNPVWAKPDWAFVEAGEPVPPPGHPSRFERGVLGDYALAIGDGYLIHGTLYQRLLGYPVTHGCVRLADDDLAAVYQSLSVGSHVLIY